MVVLVVGKTCSGKDTVAHYLEEAYHLNRVVTYTNRTMRQDDTQGVSHIFIEGSETPDYDDMFSKTEIAGFWYFMRKSQLSDGNFVAVVDPKGVEDFRDIGIPCEVVYVDCPEELILQRAVGRGTDPGVVITRLDSERERFDEFKQSGEYDYLILNVGTVDELKLAVDVFMG